MLDSVVFPTIYVTVLGAELHIHLDGAIGVETLFEVVQRRNLTLPDVGRPENVDALRPGVWVFSLPLSVGGGRPRVLAGDTFSTLFDGTDQEVRGAWTGVKGLNPNRCSQVAPQAEGWKKQLPGLGSYLTRPQPGTASTS